MMDRQQQLCNKDMEKGRALTTALLKKCNVKRDRKTRRDTDMRQMAEISLGFSGISEQTNHAHSRDRVTYGAVFKYNTEVRRTV